MRKRKLFTLTGLVLLGISLITSCDGPTLTTPKQDVISSTPVPTVAQPTTSTSQDSKLSYTYDGYYSTITNSMLSDSITLKSTLTQMVTKNYIKLSYKDAGTAMQTTDSYDGDYVECIYTGERMSKDGLGSSAGCWNREHMWAKSHGFNDTKYDAYSDLHHLRVSEASINTARNNSYFDELEVYTNSDEYGNKWTNDVFEPRDEVKGDIARMLLYMTVRYNDSTLKLELTNDKELASKSETGTQGYIGILNTILKWNYEDPVDSRELSRNEEIYKVQGNRNPFIDHPELAYYLYANECESQSITESSIPSKIEYNLKDEAAITSVNNKILSIGTVTLESKSKIEEAESLYNALDNVSKSFVSEYDILQQAIFDYQTLSSVNNQDKTISTTVEFASIAANSGSVTVNGIQTDWKSPISVSNKGLYASPSQGQGPIVLTVSNLYDTIQVIELSLTSNKEASKAGNATIVISDDRNSVTSTTEKLIKNQTYTQRIDVTSLDLSKELTITITSSFSSTILSQIKYSII